jgi:phosphatidylinositol-3-phosphatase
LVSANAWLRKWVPKILGSPAYEHRGLVIVTFDEAEASGGEADSSACCNAQPGPNLIFPDTPGFQRPGPGGGRIGAVLISPCIKPGTVVEAPYNHYSLLRSVEDNFGLPRLGYAGQRGLHAFRANVLNRPACRARSR